MDIDFSHLTQEEKDIRLFKAAEKGLIEEVTGLIQVGANVNVSDDNGWTALMVAIIHGWRESPRGSDIAIATLLIQNGANINAQNINGWTLLRYVVQWGGNSKVDFLIQNGADVSIRDNKGSTALMIAAWYGFTNIVKLLIQQGADVNEKDNTDATALMYAASSKHTDTVNFLFSVMNTEQVQQEINLHPNIQVDFDNFKQAVIDHRMDAFIKLGLFELDFNENNFNQNNETPYLPIENISLIADFYCALGNAAWHAPHAKLDSRKVCDAIANNGPLIFSSAAPNNNKRQAQDELKDERAVKKIKITNPEQSDESLEEEMNVENNSSCTIS